MAKVGVDDYLVAGHTVEELIGLARDPREPEGLPFRTARELAHETPADVPWRARPWLADGAITEVDGRVKWSGKTTWTLHLVASILDGEPFMGQPTEKSGVVFLTEQGERRS